MIPIKRVLFIAVIVIAGVIITALITGYLFRDDVKNIVVSSLNKRLTTKVEVEDITFSLIKNFPNPTLELKNVIVHESSDFITSGQVLNAEEITLYFSFRSLFKKNYSLKKVVVRNALVNLQIDEKGNVNYKVWKKADNNKSDENELSFELENVEFYNTDVLYYNIQKNQDISFLISEGTFKGNFQSEKYTLKADADLEETSVILDELQYVKNADCKAKLSLDVNSTDGIYTFTDSQVEAKGLTLTLDGTVVTGDGYFDTDLQISSPSADLPTLISFIPEKYRGPSVEYNYSGRVLFNGTLKGRSGPDSNPDFILNFESVDVNLNPKNTPYHIKKMNGKGYFTNKKSAAAPYTYLRLENFSASLEGKPVKINLEVENFKKPLISFDANLEANLKALSKFFMPDTLEEVSGNLQANIQFNGIADQKSTYRSSGNIRLNNVAFKVKQKPVPFTNLNGLIHLRGNDVMVENLAGMNGQTDFLINGVFNNLIGYFLIENQKVDITASLRSKKIDLDELMAKDQVASTKTDTVYRLSFSEMFRFDLELSVQELTFRKFRATSITGNVALESKVLNTKQLNFETAGGKVRLSGAIDDRPADSLKINYDANVASMDINRLFYEMGNFGQQTLVDKNLKGNVTADVKFSSMWSNRLDLNENSIKVTSHITIENGELNNFEPMMALNSYLKGSDLKSIKFSTLTNSIEIRNRKIFIPMMEIKSSAADIQVSGDHSFDNIVNYKLRLYLSQLLGKKVKAQNTEFGTIEDDGLGRPMIFLTMTGPASDPKISLDMNSVENKITEEIKNESKTFKNILKEEFGKKDTATAPKKQPGKKEELQIDYDDE